MDTCWTCKWPLSYESYRLLHHYTTFTELIRCSPRSVVIQITTTSHHIRVSYESTTCFCWRHWTPSSRDLSLNCIPTKSSAQWKETTSVPRRRRSERTRSYCQWSVASLLNSFNSFSTRWTTLDSLMSATSSLTKQVRLYTTSQRNRETMLLHTYIPKTLFKTMTKRITVYNKIHVTMR